LKTFGSCPTPETQDQVSEPLLLRMAKGCIGTMLTLVTISLALILLTMLCAVYLTLALLELLMAALNLGPERWATGAYLQTPVVQKSRTE
jgi:hypothetical protein